MYPELFQFNNRRSTFSLPASRKLGTPINPMLGRTRCCTWALNDYCEPCHTEIRIPVADYIIKAVDEAVRIGPIPKEMLANADFNLCAGSKGH